MPTAATAAVTLRPYQTEALDAVAAGFFDQQSRRQLVVLPTGTGKTVIFAQLLQHADVREWMETFGQHEQRMLVIAHREELLHQAADKIHAANPSLIVEIEQADQRASAMAHVVVASIQTLERRLDRFHRDAYRVVIVDEAHHCAARTYFKVLDHFGIVQSPFIDRDGFAPWAQDDTKMFLGFTATPKRGDAIGLDTVFERIAYAKDMVWMVDEGYLCRLRGMHVSTRTDLSGVSTRSGDFAQNELASVVNNAVRNEAIVAAWKQHALGRKTIAFTVDVQHANDLAQTFRDRAGTRAEAISGAHARDERHDLLRRFHAGDIDVLTNCNLLTEGFDEPSVSCIVQARPTKSSLLYIQQAGRGTRLAPGKEDCLILDCADLSSRHSLITSADLFGLPPGFNAEGQDLLGLKDKLDELEGEWPGLSLLNVSTWRDVDLRVREFDIWRRPELPAALQGHATLAWSPSLDQTSFRVRYPIKVPPGAQPRHESIEVRLNQLGQWEVAINDCPMPVVFKQMAHGVSAAEAWIREHRRGILTLINAKARWRSDPPSEKQLSALLRHNVPFDRETLTKGEATRLLDVAFSRRRQW